MLPFLSAPAPPGPAQNAAYYHALAVARAQAGDVLGARHYGALARSAATATASAEKTKR